MANAQVLLTNKQAEAAIMEATPDRYTGRQGEWRYWRQFLLWVNDRFALKSQRAFEKMTNGSFDVELVNEFIRTNP